MRVGLMIPCYIDMFYPQVGKSTLGLLERLGVDRVEVRDGGGADAVPVAGPDGPARVS